MSGELGVVGSIQVMGHNNWVDSIIVNSVKVNGHNNRF
jgi:hypothetical protein